MFLALGCSEWVYMCLATPVCSDLHYTATFFLQATRSLLREALKDPLNKRFVLLSETCNPLLPAATVYAQLMAESKSRINACAMSDKSRNVERCAHLALTVVQHLPTAWDKCCCYAECLVDASWVGLLQQGRCLRAW